MFRLCCWSVSLAAAEFIPFIKFQSTKQYRVKVLLYYHANAAITVIIAIVDEMMLDKLIIFSMMMILFMHYKCCSSYQLQRVCYRYSHKLSVRPSLDDVERISRGEAAKKRGTGSRAVPHRLNTMERKEWDLAKKRKFLLLRGSGYRKERGDSPLANIYRQLCDATNIPSISIYRGLSSKGVSGTLDIVDDVIFDFSPLRTLEHVTTVKNEIINEAKNSDKYSSLVNILDQSDTVAFGWDNYPNMLQNDVIWRIPPLCVVTSFTNRKDSRLFAEYLAVTYAGARPDLESNNYQGGDNDD